MGLDTSKIIHAPIGGGKYTVTSPLTKSDYGIMLVIEGAELPTSYQVDFSNNEHSGTSLTRIGNEDGVEIPKQFIDTGKDVFAWLYWVGEDYGKTVYKFRIPNKCRPERTNEQPTPEEQSVIDQAIAALNDAVAQTAQDVIDADASAQESAESARASANSAVQASLSESNAERAKGNAQASAESASASATASAQSASQSAQIKADVEDMVDDAQASASASAQSATASANSATTAQEFARSASTSATNAHGYASQAQTSANTASTKASEASASAQTASQKATEASQSASQALIYKTDAESAKTASQTAQGLAESARDLAQGYAEDAQGYANDAQASAESISASASQIAQNTANILKAFPTDTASGAVASFSDGADGIPLKSLIVNIDPVQDTSSGDPSPENICPISGWTEMQLQKTRANILNPSANPMWNYSNVYTLNQDGSVTQSGNDGRGWISNNFNGLFLKKGQYTLSFTTQNIICNLRTSIDDYTGNYRTTNSVLRFTLTEDCTVKWKASTSSYPVTYAVQLEVGTEATAYEPYQGQTIPINWQTEAGTVYGGKLDVRTGVLTVYPYYASYNGETLTGRWISDRDVYASGTTPTIGAQVVNIGAQGTEIQLEPHEVTSLLGQNNIFADTGDVSCEYRADTKLYIEKLTQPEEDDMVADSAITSGQFFMVGNTLYRALANIASGATITIGTNAQRVSLSDALNLVNA